MIKNLNCRNLLPFKRLLIMISFVMGCISAGWAQNSIPVTGVVTDETGETLPGVSVAIDGNKSGTITGMDGSFSISVPSRSDKLVFSYLGYENRTIAIPDGNYMVVVLKESDAYLNEVVVVGYATMRKIDVTGTISSVKAKDIEMIPVSTAAEALTGKMAGVRVVTQDGEPGADIDITIRGGMSITQDNAPLYIIDGFVSDLGLKGLDVSEIESIDVLKDASTTSIYGARGANGVVLITTKSGKKGKTSVTYDAYFGFRQMQRQVDVLDGVEFAKLQYEMAMRTGGDTFERFIENYGTWDQYETLYGGNRSLNWQDIMFGDNAFYQSQNVSISGGSDTHRFMAGYSFNDENGILMNTSNKRHNLRFKYDQKLYKNVNFQANVTYYQNKKEGDITSGSTLQNSLLYRPVSGISSTPEELIDLEEDPYTSLQNPRTAQLSQLRTSYDKNLAMNAALDFNLLQYFTLKVSGGGTWRHGRSDRFDDATSSAAKTRGGPFGSQVHSENYKWQNTNTLAYANRFKNVHSVNALVGTEYVGSQSQSLTTENRQFPDDNFGIYDLGLGSLPQKPSASYSEDVLMSYFGRVFYGYDDRYLLTLSLRADGSSKFAKKNRWGYFPSASAAWRIDSEKFMEPFDYVSALKLRVSYGQAGNNRIGNNRFRSVFDTGWYTNGAAEMPTLYPNYLANPDLKWETTIASNVGLDFGFLKNRFSGTVELYKNKSKDLLLTSSIPSYTGYTSQTRNIGSIQNKGWEVTLNFVNINTQDFTWTTDFNISFNKNKVLELADTDENYMLFKSGVGSYVDDFIVEIGKSTGLIYGYVVDGLYTVDDFDVTYNAESGRYSYTLKDDVLAHADQNRMNIQPGTQKFKNVNGDDAINGDDRTVIGNTTPKHFGGINNTFRYKNFDLSVFLNWVYGNDILNYQEGRLSSTYQTNQNQSSRFLNRFTYIDSNGNYVSEPTALAALNANATMHAVKTNGPESNITMTTSDMVEDGSFLRINNITLGYTLNPEWLKKIHLTRCRVYGTVYNLHTFTSYSGFDPEVNKRSNGGLTPGVDWAAYPKTRSFVFGVNIGF